MSDANDQKEAMADTAPGRRYSVELETLFELVDSPRNPLDQATFDALVEKRPHMESFRMLVEQRMAARDRA